ncbi:MAG: NERD domain-containing protein [Alphaproteobacteria bacterium]|nr:NERD domain-containing protein [Alphaproteobacteria bacterium]
MSIMVPIKCDLVRRPMSEQIVFEAIRKNLSDEWTVFHSFDYLTRDLNRKRWDGEIDFLLYHPVKGFLVIEVKGGAISYRNGQWYQEDRPIDPVEQAKRNKYAVRKLLQDGLHRAIPMKFAHAVCFPSCGSRDVWPAEAQEIVLTGDTLPYVEAFATKILEDTQLPLNMSGSVSQTDVMRVLSPVFEYGTKLSERIGVEEKQFFLFTEQQCAILDALEQFPRLQIKGCAGSGKTIMAIKKAEKLATQGKNVLLLCFNQLLAKYLQKSVKEFPSVKAAAFFEYCIELMKIPEAQVGKYRNNPKLYSDVLPKLLKEYLSRTCLCYDAVIVDEGQDFTKEAWDAISCLPESDGCFYIFFDPDQNIYTNELNLPDFGMPSVILNKNCRNTQKIFEALQPYQSLQTSIMGNAPVGADVHILHGDCRANLSAELERLVMAEQIPLQNIVILGAHSLEHTSLWQSTDIGRFHIVPREAELGKMEVAYYTYMKFKGCEAKVVILFEVNDADPRWRDNCGIYTAMSRAVHELIILRKD